jgi:hypothetical protein
MYECPADGCDYTGPIDSVCGHFSGCKDDGHLGHYESARAHLVEDQPLPDPDPETGTDTDRDGGDGDGDTRDENPLLGRVDDSGGDDPDGDGDDPDDGTEELPCGHERIRTADLSETRRVTCDTCGGTWRVQP